MPERQQLNELQGAGLVATFDLREFFADEADHSGGLFGGDAGDEAGLLASAQGVESGGALVAGGEEAEGLNVRDRDGDLVVNVASVVAAGYEFMGGDG